MRRTEVGPTLPDEPVKNLMESSDEEEDVTQRLELEKRKSTHQLLIVIFESIRDNFKGKPDIPTYRRILRVLSEEKQASEELKLALYKIRDIVKADDEISEKDRVTILLESRGVFSAFDSKDSELTEAFKRRLTKVLEGASKDTLLAISGLSKESISIVNSDKDLLKAVGVAMRHAELDSDSVIELLHTFHVKVTGELRNVLEEVKFDYRVVDIYLKRVLENDSNYQKLKYLEEFVKKLNDPGNAVSVSALHKVDVLKKVIVSLVGYLKDKQLTDDDDEDEQGKYKYFGQYLKILVSVTKLNVELLGFLGESLVKEWFSGLVKDKKFVSTVADVFWPMKKLCPPSIFIFLIRHSSTVSLL